LEVEQALVWGGSKGGTLSNKSVSYWSEGLFLAKGGLFFLLWCGFGSAAGAEPPLYEGYVKTIQEKLSVSPKDPRLLTILGRLYLRLSQEKEAEAAFLRALAIRPTYGHALVGMSHLAMRRGELAKARLLLTGVLRRERRHPPALAAMSEYYRKMAVQTHTPAKERALYQEGLRWILRALKEEPKAHAWHLQAGLFYLGDQRTAEAHLHFTKAVVLLPIQPCYHLALAISESLLLPSDPGRLSILQKRLTSCTKRPVLQKIAQTTWAKLSLQQAHEALLHRKKPLAKQILSTLLLHLPDVWQARLFLASLLLQEKRCKEARDLVNPALQAYPSRTEFRQFLLDPAWRSCIRPPLHKKPPRSRPSSNTLPSIQRG